MRYAAPLAMPAALGEWLGAELEARGVAAAPHYARAVLSILLHSDLEPDCDVESEAACVAALELQIQLEQQKDKEKRGRSRVKLVTKARKATKGKAGYLKVKEGGAFRRRPRSWNGDEDGLKKSAAVECLLSASDNDEWPVEKFVDELVTRLKILQLEGMDRFRGLMGSSAPNFELRTDVDSDSLTSVSTPGEPEVDLAAFPPLTSVDVSPQAEVEDLFDGLPTNPDAGNLRVAFFRMPGSRLCPPLSTSQSLETLLLDNCCSSGVGSYNGDEESITENCESFAKGRLYERGLVNDSADDVDCGWNGWANWSVPSKGNIWAPDQEDWAMLGKPEIEDPVVLIEASAVDPVLQKSLAILKHDPQLSSFSRITPGQQQQQQEVLGGGSKIFEWMGALEAANQKPPEEDEEVENLLISPKTHFCPIQEETDTEVNIKDGTTFEIDSEADQVHYLRSPEGALYLPEIEENGFGWVGWIKYMVVRPTTPTLLDGDIFEDEKLSPAFPLKFRVVQNDKGCQTELEDESEEAKSAFDRYGILNGGEVWKFNAEMLNQGKTEENSGGRVDGDEEDDGDFLNEVWNVTMDSTVKDEVDEEIGKEEVEEENVDNNADSMLVNDYSAPGADDSILDEIWDPILSNGDICEWLAQPQGDQLLPEDHKGLEMLMNGDNWPPPHIPIEYVDDELFEEIIGSVESRGSLSDAKCGSVKRKSRRRRRSGKKVSQPSQQRRRPCSFFVEGQCLQPDCKYSHDLGTIPCRFWVEATCFKGVACPFLHAKPSELKSRSRTCSGSISDASESSRNDYCPSRSGSRRQSRNSTSKSFELDLDNDFPTLGQAVQGTKTKSQPIPIKTGKKSSALDVSAASSLENSATAKRKRKKQSGQSLKDAASLTESPQTNVFSLESAVSGGRLRFLSSYKEG